VLEKHEVLQLLALRLEVVGQARLELAQPVERAPEGIDPAQGMDARIRHDADGMRPGRQRDQPDPVTLAHQVSRRQPAIRRIAAAQPLRIAGPFVDVDL